MYAQAIPIQVDVTTRNHSPASPEDRTLSYLRGELRTVSYQHKTDLQKKFGLIDDDWPETIGEFVDRIKKGKYSLRKRYQNLPRDEDDEDPAEDDTFCSWETFKRYFKFNPEKTDKKGYEKALKKLEEKEKEVDRIINVKGGEEGLKALIEYEKATFH